MRSTTLATTPEVPDQSGNNIHTRHERVRLKGFGFTYDRERSLRRETGADGPRDNCSAYLYQSEKHVENGRPVKDFVGHATQRIVDNLIDHLTNAIWSVLGKILGQAAKLIWIGIAIPYLAETAMQHHWLLVTNVGLITVVHIVLLLGRTAQK